MMVLTKCELEIMDILWESEKPLSRADFLANGGVKSWKDSSIHILLNGLLQKGAIQEVGFIKRSKTYGRTFLPTLTREQYFATTIFSYQNKPQIVELIDALLQREDITPEEMIKIKELVANK